MSEEPGGGWLIRHVDLIYRITLVALIGLWVMFPPHASQPSVAKSPARIVAGGGQ